MEVIQDDMVFNPYNPEMEGDWGMQALLKTNKGEISVRTGGSDGRLMISKEKPYEVWYPDKENPTGEQTADDIFNWILKNK